MPITQYTSRTLLQKDVIENIKKEADLLVSNKEVDKAWLSAIHLKKQLAEIPPSQIQPVLDEYRRITSKLKALALPVLDQNEVENLLQNNLEFLDTQAERYLAEGLSAWLASQPDENVPALKKKLKSKVDSKSLFAPKILSVLDNV